MISRLDCNKKLGRWRTFYSGWFGQDDGRSIQGARGYYDKRGRRRGLLTGIIVINSRYVVGTRPESIPWSLGSSFDTLSKARPNYVF